MIVSHHKAFVFVHNPKTAGMAVRSKLMRLHDDETYFWGVQRLSKSACMADFAHLTLDEIRESYPLLYGQMLDYQSVVFIRNPVDRFKSSCREFFRRFDQNVFGESDPRLMPDKIERLLARITSSHVKDDYRFIHFRPQHKYVCSNDQIVIKRVLPFSKETPPFSQAMHALGQEPMSSWDMINASSGSDISLSAEARDRISQIYKIDYQLIGSLEGLASVL